MKIASRTQRITTRLIATLGALLLAYAALASMPAVTSRVTKLAAHGFVTLCAHTDDKPLCYETNVPKLLYVVSVNDVFSVVRAIQQEDTSYRFCHVLAHQIGDFEVRRDPNHWMDLMHENPPDNLCSNGYVHGVIVGRFNRSVLTEEQIDAIVPDLSRACESAPGWNPPDLLKAMCYHGMGHVLTHITQANLPLAVSYCKKIGVKGDGRDFSGICESGVFMQIFQLLEPEDFALVDHLPVKPTKENLASFCGAFVTEDERSYCYGEGWYLFRDDIRSAAGMRSFCETGTDAVTKENCFRTVFAIGARQSLGDPGRELSVCSALPSTRAQNCINALSNAFIEEDKTKAADASAVCARAPEAYRRGCYENLVWLGNFNFGDDSSAREGLCTALPSPYADQCRTSVR